MRDIRVTGILCLIFAVLAIITLIWLIYHYVRADTYYDLYGVLIWFVMPMFVFAGMCGVGHLMNIHTYNKEYDIHTYILSLNRETKVEGYFTLGCGRIESKEYYVAWYVSGHNEYGTKYSLLKLEVNSVDLIETDALQPQYWQHKSKGSYETSSCLYVPVGTILQEYKL